MSSSSTISTTLSTNSTQEEDDIVPSKDQIDRMFSHSQQVWQNLYKKATSMRLERDTVRLSDLIHGLPAIPDNLQGVQDLAGQAIWEMKATSCKHPHITRAEQKRRWNPTRRRPTLCMISDGSYFSHADSKSNGIALLFFGWAYILCMAMLERQRIPMRYSKDKPTVPGNEHQSDEQKLTVDIGHASEEEFRWWSALFSSGQGWRSASEKQPVWAVAYTGNVKIRFIAQGLPASSPDLNPPSSRQAANFLSRFVSMYNLESQVPLALAMVLTLPLHNETCSMVKLPSPLLARQDAPMASPSSVDREYSNLPRYMTLSSNPVFLSSTLWAIFWEPGVECNLVSPWCDAIIEVVKPLVERGDLEMLGHVLALRRPNIAALWYGMAACGHTKTILAIAPFLQTLHTPVPSRPIPEIAAWTGSPQSFMDLCGSGPYVRAGDHVHRADVWRLRQNCWNLEPEGAPFRNTPTCPWPPFGSIKVEELEIPVRLHLGCNRHDWVYVGWTWLSDDGTVLVESPLENDKSLKHDSSPLKIEPQVDLIHSSPSKTGYTTDHIASERAVGDIFRWSATEMELSGRNIYLHRWVEALADLDMDGNESIDSGSDIRQGASNSLARRIEDWVMGIEVGGDVMA
ncbi:hypothetical protein ACHAPT_013413 [Fusarium lateritium]